MCVCVYSFVCLTMQLSFLNDHTSTTTNNNNNSNDKEIDMLFCVCVKVATK